MIDEKNGNTDWQDAEDLEISQLMEYKSFKSLSIGAPIPEGYKKIPCHFVYDLKHMGKCKGRLVAGGHRTDTNGFDLLRSGVAAESADCHFSSGAKWLGALGKRRWKLLGVVHQRKGGIHCRA
jgi:hypothetical protein